MESTKANRGGFQLKNPTQNLKCITNLLKFPYFCNKKQIWIHPEDADRFLKYPAFIPVTNVRHWFPLTPPRAWGMLYGYELFIQDDLQVLILSLKKGRKDNEN